MKSATLLIAIALGINSPASVENPESVVRNFFRAAYTRDAATFNKLITPPEARELLSKEPVSNEKLAEITSRLGSLDLRQIQPFRLRGAAANPDASGEYPNETTTRYQTSFDGDITIISLVKRNGHWFVDGRWWLKLREMAQRTESTRVDEKELLIKRFLLALLRMDRKAAVTHLVPGADSEIIFRGAPRYPEPSDVLPSLVIEMPLVEAESDEVYPLLSGKLTQRSAAGDETVMVGLFGPFEIVFRLKKIKNEWRILPDSYFQILNQ